MGLPQYAVIDIDLSHTVIGDSSALYETINLTICYILHATHGLDRDKIQMLLRVQHRPLAFTCPTQSARTRMKNSESYCAKEIQYT